MPPREPSAYVWDVRDASSTLVRMTRGVSLEAYLADEMLRLATERLLMIIGEAVNRLRALDPAMAARLGPADKIVSFRNILVHVYFAIDHSKVWHVLQDHLPQLLLQSEEVWSLFASDFPDETTSP